MRSVAAVTFDDGMKGVSNAIPFEGWDCRHCW
jgi:hypothetical protein